MHVSTYFDSSYDENNRSQMSNIYFSVFACEWRPFFKQKKSAREMYSPKHDGQYTNSVAIIDSILNAAKASR